MGTELVERVVLLGGSALSPWAVQREPLQVKRRVAELIGCPGDMEADDIAPCLRLKSVEELLDIKLDVPRFTSGYAPFIDGAILPQGSTSSQVSFGTFFKAVFGLLKRWMGSYLTDSTTTKIEKFCCSN